MPIAAIYARVSSDKQREESTIGSQTAALIEFSRSRGYHVPAEWVFEDEGYSGASLVRPGLERLRDLAAEGQIEAVLVHAPDGTVASSGVRRLSASAGKDRWLVGIAVQSQNRECHYRQRNEPEGASRRRVATTASADFCSSGGSPGSLPSLR
jgi:predicted site-specific integrase-resolvase